MPGDIVPGEGESGGTTPEIDPTTGKPKEVEPDKKHPLEEGGVRFNEVYAKWKQADADRQALAGQVDILNRQLQELSTKVTTTTSTQPQEVSVENILEAHASGRITDADKDRYIYTIAKRDAKKESLAEVNKAAVTGSTISRAQEGVAKYIDAFPSLRDNSSDDFKAVAREYQSLVNDGHPDDVRTQHLAVKSVLGSLDRHMRSRGSDDLGRGGNSTFSETGGGGGRDTTTGKDDPLKLIPKPQIEYWQKLGYTREMMLNEAKYFSPKRRWQ